MFSLIHKFNQEVTPDTPYSRRDDIIVVSDEAHRTQSGKLARNMRLALPNAAFILATMCRATTSNAAKKTVPQ